jgi:putative PIN family toxin of toxin-antitoxin system
MCLCRLFLSASIAVELSTGDAAETEVVLDSNIFISSFFWKGNQRKIFDRVTNGLDELYITDEILQEIAIVMPRKKFDTKTNEIEEYIKIIESYSIKLFPQKVVEEISRDKDDNKNPRPKGIKYWNVLLKEMLIS